MKARNAIRVRRAALPTTGAIAEALPGAHYADAFVVRLAVRRPVSASEATRALLTAAPAWVDALMRLRDRAVRPLGLKTAGIGLGTRSLPASLRLGARAGIFLVRSVAANEVLLGEEDRHLDFLLSVRVKGDVPPQRLVVTTVVRFNGWLGRLYFFFVRPCHSVIVPALLRRAAARLTAASNVRR